MSQTLKVEERAQAGLQWLDANHPGWEQRLRSDLNVENGSKCVVACLSKSGQFSPESCKELGIEDPKALGFFVSGDVRDPAVAHEYAVLTMHFKSGRQERLRRSQPDRLKGEAKKTIAQLAMQIFASLW